MLNKILQTSRSKSVKIIPGRKGIVVGFIVVVGLVTIVVSQAASSTTASLEAESGTPLNGATKTTDSTASSGMAVKFGQSTPPQTGGQPTAANTGPRYPLTDMTPEEFKQTKTCNRQRITGNVAWDENQESFDQNIIKGKTLNLTDCRIEGIFAIIIGHGEVLPLDQIPTVNMDYVYIASPIYSTRARYNINHTWVNKGQSQFKLTGNWNSPSVAEYPLTIRNSVLIADYKTQPYHSEAMQTPNDMTVSGMQFINTAFMVRAGPLNNTGITATVNFKGRNTTFDGCYFLWEGEPPVPAWYSVDIAGPANNNIVVKNSWFEKGVGGYDTKGKDELSAATYINNRDYNTGQFIPDH